LEILRTGDIFQLIAFTAEKYLLIPAKSKKKKGGD
jgi:hypothetical protein